MVRCYPNVGCTPLDHGQNRSQDTTYCADFLAVHICQSGQGEKVTEQFICPVNQVHIHATSDRLSTGDPVRSSKRFREIVPVCKGRRKLLKPFGRPILWKTQRYLSDSSRTVPYGSPKGFKRHRSTCGGDGWRRKRSSC